jgi:hypothetical protein
LLGLICTSLYPKKALKPIPTTIKVSPPLPMMTIHRLPWEGETRSLVATFRQRVLVQSCQWFHSRANRQIITSIDHFARKRSRRSGREENILAFWLPYFLLVLFRLYVYVIGKIQPMLYYCFDLLALN